MYVHSQDNLISQDLLIKGVYEEQESRLFTNVTKEGMIVVDIGANVGYYTLMAAGIVGKEGKVFAFEPEPGNFRLLRKNIQVNRYSNVIAVRKAISDKTGSACLFLDPVDSGNHAMHDCHGGREFIVVDTTTLDEFFEGKNCQIDVVKIDIQGAEMTALRGMKNILTKNRNVRIFVEYWPEGLQRSAVSPVKLLEILSRYGFTLYDIDADMKPVKSTLSLAAGRGHTNLYCVRNAEESKQSSYCFGQCGNLFTSRGRNRKEQRTP